jgi:EAL domain-containing protein (putative c-di-GMP-specific phosphodiesterase class I)
LSTLRSLPFDQIKIDRSFVTNLPDNKESLAIVRAVTALAHALSIPVCVEGIESERVQDSVLTLGCAMGQGWYFGKAMTSEQALDLLVRSEPQNALVSARSA